MTVHGGTAGRVARLVAAAAAACAVPVMYARWGRPRENFELPRLVAHTRGRTSRQPFMGVFSVLVGEPLHFVMQTRQFHGLRTRAGAQA